MTAKALAMAAPLITLALNACALRGPSLSYQALGCYHVSADGWTPHVADVVGFDALPPVVALDSAFKRNGERRVMVPRDWRIQGARENHASWGNTAGDWRLLPGDTLIFVRSANAFHELAGDSIVVQWSAWGGSVTAFLAPTEDGYSGIGQIGPRQLAKGLPPVWILLQRIPCDDLSSQLVPCSAP
jgi:hypothetical protein